MGLACVQPKAGTGDTIHQGLDDLGTLIDKVLAHHQNARHVVGPIFAGLKEDAPKASDFVGRFYYNQKPALLRWALTKPMDRVTYSPLAPRKADFDMVRDLMIETGVLNKKIEFSDYTDTRFSDQASIQTPWRYEPGTATAR